MNIQHHQQHLPQGLIDIRTLLGEKRHTPGFVYDHLNHQQRTVLCAAVCLPSCRQHLTFDALNNDERIRFHKAILLMESIFKAFLNANALSPCKFITKDQTIKSK